MTCPRCGGPDACAQVGKLLICGPCWDWLWEKTGFVRDVDDANSRDNLLAIGRGERRKAERNQ